MIRFRMAEHTQHQGQTMLEVWLDGRFIASIYAVEDPEGRARISIVTKHGIDVDMQSDTLTSTAIATIEEERSH